MSGTDPAALPIGEALRHLRQRLKLTQQAAASRFEGSPDFRTISHWETGRKAPSLPLLARYLDALGLDFHDLQNALDQVRGWASGQRVDELAGELEGLAGRVDEVERLIERVAERLAGRILEVEQRIGLSVDPVGAPQKK